jgi:hypothetical protein
MYVMANVIVLGAEVNWWFHERRQSGRELTDVAAYEPAR